MANNLNPTNRIEPTEGKPQQAPGSCGPQWCGWRALSRRRSSWRCRAWGPGCGRTTGSGSTGPCTAASHSGTPPAASPCNTAALPRPCQPLTSHTEEEPESVSNSRVDHFLKVQNSCNQLGSKPVQKTESEINKLNSSTVCFEDLSLVILTLVPSSGLFLHL